MYKLREALKRGHEVLHIMRGSGEGRRVREIGNDREAGGIREAGCAREVGSACGIGGACEAGGDGRGDIRGDG